MAGRLRTALYDAAIIATLSGAKQPGSRYPLSPIADCRFPAKDELPWIDCPLNMFLSLPASQRSKIMLIAIRRLRS